jgi:predicted esterase
VISVDFARSARAMLTGAGLDVAYLESDAGHWIPPEALEPAARLVASVG